ncbi:TPA: hypothetical protein ACH3X1_003324 [Trebouxia sp. C0004]
MQSLHVKPSCKQLLWRKSRPKLSSFVLKAQASSAEDKRDAVAERIRKARLYREPSNDQAQQSKQYASLTQPTIQRSVQTNTEAPEHLSAFGDSQATQQAEQLLAAIQEVQQAPQASAPDAASTDAAMQAAIEPKAAASTSQPKPGKVLSKADMLAKISQAKAYKQEKEAQPGITPAIVPAQSIEVQQQHEQEQRAAHQPKDSFSATQRRPARQEANESGAPVEEAHVENSGLGSASQAAGYLQQAVRGTDASKGMRMETYSVLKEQEMRKQKVEIISVDKSYSTDKKVMDPNYNPKVSTWGVFERPANISEAYGGGRTIKAGSPLEDAAATQARKERIAAALSRFKRDSGTLVDPAVQQACQEAFDEGEQLFKDKLVAAALSKYTVAAELMPLRTELGGKSRLQKAICLDSLGQNKEAFVVYGLIERHPNADVAKVAKRMIFGFRAMDNLKAHTISYSVTKGAYDKYFNSLSGDWNAAYVSNDEDSTELTKVIILASAVMLLPLVFLAVKIWL